MEKTSITLRKDIANYIPYFNNKLDKIPDAKRSRLNDLALYVHSKIKSKSPVKLVFVSPTDVSFSAMGQVWAKAIVVYHQLKGLESFSGGNVGNIHPMAIEALINYGFDIKKSKPDLFTVKYADNYPAMKLFSKPFEHTDIPATDYVAIVINPLDIEMPMLYGAELKLPLNYDVISTETEGEKYRRVCRQLGVDMLFIFSQITSI